MKVRKRPEVFDAEQFDGKREIPGVVISPVLEPTPQNPTGVYGQLRDPPNTCRVGDWVIRHPDGHFEVMDPMLFAKIYEVIPSTALPWIDSHSTKGR